MKRSPRTWSEPLQPGELVVFSGESEIYLVLRTFFSDRLLDNVAECLTPNGKTHQFYEDFLTKVK